MNLIDGKNMHPYIIAHGKNGTTQYYIELEKHLVCVGFIFVILLI